MSVRHRRSLSAAWQRPFRLTPPASQPYGSNSSHLSLYTYSNNSIVSCPHSYPSFIFNVKMSSQDGSYRGYRRGRGKGSWSRIANFSRAGATQNSAPLEPKLGPTIDSINIKTLLTEEDAPAIKGVEYIASCNWNSGKFPVILVPGQSPQSSVSIIEPN
jgi:hypothetical protein